MRVIVSVNKKQEEMLVTLQYPSNSDLETFSEILSDYSEKINDLVEFQTIHTPTQWTFFFYTANKLENLSKELEQTINAAFGIEVVEIKEYE